MHTLIRTGAARRVGSLIIGVVLIVVVTIVAFGSDGQGNGGQNNNQGQTSNAHTDDGQIAKCDLARPLTEAHGLVGSEKEGFFNDERVRREFACAGLAITVDSTGSREMPSMLSHAEYNFAFPSSSPTAQKIMDERGITERYTPFSSPMAVATFQPIVNVLTRAGIIQTATDGSPVVDIAALVDTARRSIRWDQLPGNTEYPARKAVLLNTTDPRDSNSAIMYLAIASHVANGNAVVTTQDQVRRVMPNLCQLMLGQGDMPETSQVLFNRYLVDGMGRTPAALVYEAQFVTTAPGHKPDISGDRVLLFPRPTVYSRHTLVPLDGPDGTGHRVGQALRDDPKLTQLAAEYGFRPERPPSDNPAGSRPSPPDVVEPPSFEIMESMLGAFEPGGQCTG
jgi:hypothetical protein